MRAWVLAFVIAAFAAPALAQEDAARQRFRAIYEELVEIDTSPTTGSCTRAAEAMLVHLRNAGYSEADAQVIVPEGKPDDGNLVAVLHGASRQRAILLLAHIDVVDATPRGLGARPVHAGRRGRLLLRPRRQRRQSHGRGLPRSHGAPQAGGLSPAPQHHAWRSPAARKPPTASTASNTSSTTIADGCDADFAINEGAGGVLGADGRPVAFNVQAGEKIHQVMHPRSHQSRRPLLAPRARQRDLSPERRRSAVWRSTSSRSNSTPSPAPSSNAWRRSSAARSARP